MTKKRLFPLVCNKRFWRGLNPEDYEIWIEQLFQHYRTKGFPYFPFDDLTLDRELKKLVLFDYRKLIDHQNKTIRQSMHGLSWAWPFFPHSWEVRCGKQKTPWEVFNDDDLFKQVIRKRTQIGDNMSDAGIRKILKIFSGAQSVSNFRPTAAACVYSIFCDRGDVVWDMCAGFGGRLLGAFLLDLNYIGTDPSSHTYRGLRLMAKKLGMDSQLWKIGSESYLPEAHSLDFCFTSPPYFDNEVYAQEETQSCIKYPNPNKWMDHFIGRTFFNCFIGLKPGKFMAINIADVRSFKDLEKQLCNKAQEIGFIWVDTWFLQLSRLGGTGYKTESIFIFQKP